VTGFRAIHLEEPTTQSISYRSTLGISLNSQTGVNLMLCGRTRARRATSKASRTD
jgi:hypothetical protein